MAGCSLCSWRGCPESLCPFEVPDFFLSPAKAFLEHWRDVQVSGLRAPECLFAQLASLQVSVSDAYSQHLQSPCWQTEFNNKNVY